MYDGEVSKLKWLILYPILLKVKLVNTNEVVKVSTFKIMPDLTPPLFTYPELDTLAEALLKAAEHSPVSW